MPFNMTPPEKPARDIFNTPRVVQSNGPLFPFLDLPKDIRLIVYERMPIKVAHHVDEEMTLVYRTIPGINILATCSFINDEASAILRPRLAAIKGMPVQLIVSPMALKYHDDLADFLRCLAASEANCPLGKDMRKISTFCHWGVGGQDIGYHRRTSIRNAPAQRVSIAVRGYTRLTDSPSTIAGLQLRGARHLQAMLKRACKNDCARDLNVKLRLVLITKEEKEKQEQIGVLLADPNVARGFPGFTSPLISGGAPIEGAEWEEDWAAGDR